MSSQVGSGHVAIFPTFKGFRTDVVKETSAAGTDGGKQFDSGFKKATKSTGATAGKSFKDSFGEASRGMAAAAVKSLTAEVSKTSAQLSAARLKEQDAAGKVRVAEAQLGDARKKYAADSVQVVRAEERLATSSRGLEGIQSTVRSATERLSASQRELAGATDKAASASLQQHQTFRQASSNFLSAGRDSATKFGEGFKSNVAVVFAGNFLANLARDTGRGIALGLAAGIKFGIDAVGIASDLGEALNATKVTFGQDISDQLKILGSTAPKRLALSRTAFAGFATQFSSFAKTIRGNDVTGFIDELTNRGADFASVYNLEVADALELFQSGLAGETEPLRKYGLDLSAASVSAYAYAKGIAKSGEELTETQKVQARYGLLLEKTSTVQGDNANTAGELAGQQRRLAVAFEETQLKLGESLLPAFSGLVGFANDTLIPSLDGIIDKVGPKIGAALDTARPKFEELLTKVTPLVESFVVGASEQGIPAFTAALDDMVDSAPEWFSFFTDLDKGVRDADAGFRDAQKATADYFAPFRQWTMDAGTNFANFATGVGIQGQSFRSTMGQAGDGVALFTDGLGRGLSTAGTVVGGFITKTTTEFLGLPARLKQAGTDAAAGFLLGLGSQLETIRRKAREIADEVVNTIAHALDSHSPSRKTMALGGYAAEGFAIGISKGTPEVDKAVRHMVALPSLPSSSSSVAASVAAMQGAGSGNVYIDKIVAPDDNPVVSGRIMAKEFLRAKAG
jgi:hypothetical protein